MTKQDSKTTPMDQQMWKVLRHSKIAVYRQRDSLERVFEKTSSFGGQMEAASALTQELEHHNHLYLPSLFESKFWEVRSAIIQSNCIQPGKVHEEFVYQGLKGENEEVRFHSINKLRNFSIKRQRSMEEACVKCLDDSSEKVRASAASLVGWWNDRAHVPKLLCMAKDENDSRAKTNAVESIVSFINDDEFGKDVKDAITACMDSDNHRLATTAASIVYPYSKDRANKILMKLLKADIQVHRAAAAWAIGQTGDHHTYLDVILEAMRVEEQDMAVDQLTRAMAKFADIIGDFESIMKKVF